MIEKEFNKAYPILRNGVSQSALTRTANRLLAEYAEAFGSASVPDEIKTIVEKIRRCEESEEYEDEYKDEMGGDGDSYDKYVSLGEMRAWALWDEDEYGDPVYRVTWYFYSCEIYTKYVGKQKFEATSLKSLLKKTSAAKGKYRYFCTHRPPSEGVIPKGSVSMDTYWYAGTGFLGEVTYNEQPSEEEAHRWGLVFDESWERIRRAYMEIDE